MSWHSVSNMAPDITLSEVVATKHPSPPRWSPDGAWVAWLWDDGGNVSLWVSTPDGAPACASRGTTSVSGFDWCIDGRICYSQGGNLYVVKPGEEPGALTKGNNGDIEPRWSRDGSRLAFSRGGALGIWDFAENSLALCKHEGRIVAGADGHGIRWSPDGGRLALTIVDGEQRDLPVLDSAGKPLWRTRTPDQETAALWVSDELIHYTVIDLGHHVREHRLVNLCTGIERTLVREESPKGMKDELAPVLRPGATGVVYVLTP